MIHFNQAVIYVYILINIINIRKRKKTNKMTRELALSNDKKQLMSLLNAQQLHQHQPIVHIHHELPLINLINTFLKTTKENYFI